MAKHTTVSPEHTRHTNQTGNDLQQRIRLRAYELYEQRGRDHGHDLDDWLQAESEMAKKGQTTLAA